MLMRCASLAGFLASFLLDVRSDGQKLTKKLLTKKLPTKSLTKNFLVRPVV